MCLVSLIAHNIPQVSAVNIKLLESETPTLKLLAYRVNRRLVTLEQKNGVNICREIRGMQQYELKLWIGSPAGEFLQLLGQSVLKIRCRPQVGRLSYSPRFCYREAMVISGQQTWYVDLKTNVGLKHGTRTPCTPGRMPVVQSIDGSWIELTDPPRKFFLFPF